MVQIGAIEKDDLRRYDYQGSEDDDQLATRIAQVTSPKLQRVCVCEREKCVCEREIAIERERVCVYVRRVCERER